MVRCTNPCAPLPARHSHPHPRVSFWRKEGALRYGRQYPTSLACANWHLRARDLGRFPLCHPVCEQIVVAHFGQPSNPRDAICHAVLFSCMSCAKTPEKAGTCTVRQDYQWCQRHGGGGATHTHTAKRKSCTLCPVPCALCPVPCTVGSVAISCAQLSCMTTSCAWYACATCAYCSGVLLPNCDYWTRACLVPACQA